MGSVQHRRERAWIDKHFDGRLRQAAETRMRSHLNDCADCRGYYERHQLLSRLDPTALSVKERLARSLDLHPSQNFVWKPLAAAMLAGATALLVIYAIPRIDESAHMQARGGEQTLSSAQLVVYHIRNGAKALPVTNTIAVDDELAFAYSNPGGKKRLMVFAIDSQRQVFWYFPAWLDASSDPVAVPVQTSAEPVELPEAVSHALHPGPLELHWLFVDETLSVTQVEAMLKRQRNPASALPLAGAIQGSLHIEVNP